MQDHNGPKYAKKSFLDPKHAKFAKLAQFGPVQIECVPE